MKVRFFLAVTAVVLTLTTSADHKSRSCSECWQSLSSSPAIDQTIGVNIHFTEAQPGEIKMIADGGFHWVRMDFKWDLTEPERGRYDFSPYDRLLKALDEYHLRALLILDYGNPLYTDDKAVRTEEARQAFARWAVAAAKHFSGRGIWWEVFNEPNIKIFWPPQPHPDEYTLLAVEVGRAFEKHVPNETLIGPATSGIEFNFLEACFKANLLQYWNAVSVHPYRQKNPETAANEFAQLRQMVAHYRTARLEKSGPDIPVISGEWGYSSVWRDMNEEKQASMLARTMLTNSANGIPISIWYDWRDDGSDASEPEDHFGVVRHQYRGASSAYEPKPAYLAAKTLVDQLRGFRFLERLSIGADDDYVLVFGRDDKRRIVAWTTSASPHRVSITGVSGSFSLIGTTGEQRGRVIANEKTVALELSTFPLYLKPLD